MATPSKHSAPQQGRTPSQLAAATPPVSTPFSQPHTAFSPRGPRSSPQQFKKSPANSTTLMGHSAAGLNFDSPSAVAAMSSLGIGGPMDIGLDTVGVGTLGGLGGEDERVKRLDGILEILSERKGRVSEAGLERLAQRMGLSTYFEDTHFEDRKCKQLFIGGSALEVIIVFDNNVVQNVTVAFPMSAPLVARHTEKAGQILLRDLSLRPNQSPLTKTLDKFAANLEHLAALEKLSVMPGLDCQEAMAGMYENLERLHEWDMERLRNDPAMSGRPDSALALVSMCAHNGRPVMNARDRVGLAIQYWKEHRLASPTSALSESFCDTTERLWSVRIGCAPLNGLIYPPLRVSDDWISPAIQKAEPLPDEILATPFGPVLDWREPPSTMLPADEGKDAALDPLVSQKLPEVTFIATLDPPVTFPQSVWVQLYQITGAPTPAAFPAATFDSIYFPIPTGINHVPSEHREIKCRRVISIPGSDGELCETIHQNTLYIYKPVYGQTLTELPFSHPRQLVAMLPTLRQYTLLSALLENSFSQREVTGPVQGPKTVDATTTTRDALAAFRLRSKNRAIPSKSKEGLNLDVTLTVHPVPRLQVGFPYKSSSADVMLEIRPNGVVHVLSQNIVPDEDNDIEPGKGKGRQFTKEDLGRLLETMEDLDDWCEWIRTRLT